VPERPTSTGPKWLSVIMNGGMKTKGIMPPPNMHITTIAASQDNFTSMTTSSAPGSPGTVIVTPDHSPLGRFVAGFVFCPA